MNTRFYRFKDVCDNTVKIRPCRLCGRKPEFYFFDVSYDFRSYYHLGCAKCGICNFQEDGYDELLKNWNDSETDIETWKKNVDIL